MGIYRQGRKNPHTIYWQRGDEPSDQDTPLGLLISGTDASRMVEMANLGLEAEEVQLHGENFRL